MKTIIILIGLFLLIGCCFKDSPEYGDYKIIKQVNGYGDTIYKLSRYTIDPHTFNYYWDTPNAFNWEKDKNIFKTYDDAYNAMQRAIYKREQEKKAKYYTIE